MHSRRWSVEIPRPRIQRAQQCSQILQAMRDQVADAVHVFPLPLHRQQACFQQCAALCFGDVLPYHHVDQAVFVLQGQEDNAAGRLRLLARGHQPGHPHMAVVRPAAQHLCIDAMNRAQLGPDLPQRMRPETEPEPRVIRQRVLSLRGQRQRDGLFGRTVHAEQRQLRLDAGDGPARTMAMTGQPAQRGRIRQQILLPPIKTGTLTQVGDVGEGMLPARRHQAPRGGFGKAAHHAQAQPDRA